MLQQLIDFVHKKEIPETVKVQHNLAFKQLQLLGPIAKALDSKDFMTSEFLLLLKIKNQLIKGIGEYQGLKNSTILLKVALQVKDILIGIQEIESLSQNLEQFKLYNFVNTLLKEDLTPEDFQKLVNSKLEEILPNIDDEEEKEALKVYVQYLEQLTLNYGLGLEILILFKQYQLKDCLNLKCISSLVKSLQQENIEIFPEIFLIIKKNYSTLEQLAPIIAVSPEKNNPHTYSLILQYIALGYKHQALSAQFARLIKVLKEWKTLYLSVNNLREKYNFYEYKQPKEFSEEIVGEYIFSKYQDFPELF